MTRLSIVFPCFNEADSIDNLVTSIHKAIDGYSDTEVILVDNGSTDSTLEKLVAATKELDTDRFRTIRIEKNLGYGHGIMEGVRAATGEVIAWTHADLQTDPLDVLKASQLFLEDPSYPKCILKGRRKERGFIDSFFTAGMSLIATIFLKVRLSDVNAQPKMFHRDFLEKMPAPPLDFSLDLYLLFQARHHEFPILEYPVHFGERIHGESKGGGTMKGKWKLVIRTWRYLIKLKRELGR